VMAIITGFDLSDSKKDKSRNFIELSNYL